MSSFKFKNIDKQKRNRDIEGVVGTELGLAGGVTLQVLAATDANPRWKQFGQDYLDEVKRLIRAKASDERVKAFQADQFARIFVIGWDVLDAEDDSPIPLTYEACVAYLMESDDAIPAIQATVFDNQNFRGARIEAIAAHLKN